MSNFKLKKGVNLSLAGAVSGTSTTQVSAKRYAVVPDDFTGIIPRLEVKEGDKVLAGDALYHDKNHPQIKISSPVSGTIEAIERGERRKILSIVILPDSENQFKVFNAKDAKELMLESGLWAAMRQRPYDIVPDPDVVPRDVFVTTFDTAPLAAPMSLQVAGKEEYLQKGIDALAKMTPGKVYVGCAPDAELSLKGCEVNTFAGPHPAGNAGVQLANVKPVNKGETVWTLDAVTVARLGELIATKKLPVETIVAVVGENVTTPKLEMHYWSRHCIAHSRQYCRCGIVAHHFGQRAHRRESGSQWLFAVPLSPDYRNPRGEERCRVYGLGITQPQEVQPLPFVHMPLVWHP